MQLGHGSGRIAHVEADKTLKSLQQIIRSPFFTANRPASSLGASHAHRHSTPTPVYLPIYVICADICGSSRPSTSLGLARTEPNTEVGGGGSHNLGRPLTRAPKQKKLTRGVVTVALSPSLSLPDRSPPAVMHPSTLLTDKSVGSSMRMTRRGGGGDGHALGGGGMVAPRRAASTARLRSLFQAVLGRWSAT